MTKVIRVDDYTYDLAKKVVQLGKASNFANAIDKALASYLDIPYKSRQERQLEETVAHLHELAKMAAKEE